MKVCQNEAARAYLRRTIEYVATNFVRRSLKFRIKNNNVDNECQEFMWSIQS